jgi:hypothetical protein
MISKGYDRHLSLKVIILLARLLLREMSDDFTSKGSQGRELFVLSSTSSALFKYRGNLLTTAKIWKLILRLKLKNSKLSNIVKTYKINYFSSILCQFQSIFNLFLALGHLGSLDPKWPRHYLRGKLASNSHFSWWILNKFKGRTSVLKTLGVPLIYE